MDGYCAPYRAVFPNVRQFEQFSHLELGLVAETKCKLLPRLAQTTKADPQALLHFLAQADWSEEDLCAARLELTRQALRERPFILCVDETGDRKKGKTTDYVAHQYIGNVHTLADGVVSVNVYGVLDTVTFPLAFNIFKPQRWLKLGDVYKSKLQLAVELIQELAARGFHCELARHLDHPTYPAWTEDRSWKHRLTYLRLLLQPFVCACLLLPRLRFHPLPHLSAGLADLCALMYTYHPLLPKCQKRVRDLS